MIINTLFQVFALTEVDERFRHSHRSNDPISDFLKPLSRVSLPD